MVLVNDYDVGLYVKIIYYIIFGNEKGYFYLEEKIGVFYLIKFLDYEEIIKFILIV